MFMNDLPSEYPSEEFFALLSETFRAMGDTSRIKLIWAISKNEKSVSQLCETFQMSQPAVSHHLRNLRQLRLVKVRKEGASSFYSLDDAHIVRLLREGTDHVEDLIS